MAPELAEELEAAADAVADDNVPLLSALEEEPPAMVVVSPSSALSRRKGSC